MTQQNTNNERFKEHEYISLEKVLYDNKTNISLNHDALLFLATIKDQTEVPTPDGILKDSTLYKVWEYNEQEKKKAILQNALSSAMLLREVSIATINDVQNQINELQEQLKLAQEYKDQIQKALNYGMSSENYLPLATILIGQMPADTKQPELYKLPE